MNIRKKAVLTALFLILTFLPPYPSQAAVKQNAKSDLDSYVQLIKKYDPYAIITGWFWDWRSISVYRRNAGYHLGYDIAMPAGCLVPSGWSGTVIAVTPWSSSEWGISLLTNNGYVITFGHLIPCVSVGSPILPGTAVGTVARDHVDIKITDPSGNYIDFGKTSGLFPIDPNAVFMTDKSFYLHSPQNRAKIIKAKQSELSLLKGSSAVMTEYLDEEKILLRDSQENLERMKRLRDEELISTAKLKEEEQNLKNQKEKVQDLQKRYNNQQQRITALRKELKAYNAKELPTTPAKPKKTSEIDQKRLKMAKEKMEKYKKLYEEGAVSRFEKEEAEKDYQRLRLEILMKE